MNRKNALLSLLVLTCVGSMSVYSMDDDDGVEEVPRRTFTSKQTHKGTTNQMFVIGKQGGRGPSNIKEALESGCYSGVQQGAAQVTASLIHEGTQLAILKLVEMYYSPSKEELAQLAQAKQFQNVIEEMEKKGEKKQENLARFAIILNATGKNVGAAQKAFDRTKDTVTEVFGNPEHAQLIEDILNSQVNRMDKDFKELKKEKISHLKKELAQETEKKLNEFKEQQGISDTSNLTPEQTHQLETFEKLIEREHSLKIKQFKQELIKKHTQQTIDHIQNNEFASLLSRALVKDPETKYLDIFNAYSDMAISTMQNEQAMMAMDNMLLQNLATMMNDQSEGAE